MDSFLSAGPISLVQSVTNEENETLRGKQHEEQSNAKREQSLEVLNEEEEIKKATVDMKMLHVAGQDDNFEGSQNDKS